MGEVWLVELPLESSTVGRIKLPMEKIRTIQFTGTSGECAVQLVNGDNIRGKPGFSKIDIAAVFGKITVPVEHIGRIEMRAAGKQALDAGLVLHFAGDQLNDGRLPDSSANQIHGTVHGAVQVVESALKFNGTRDYVEIPFQKALGFAPGSQFTLAMWVNPQPRGRAQALLVKGDNEYWDWGLYVSHGNTFVTGTMSGPQGFQAVSRTVAEADKWYHLAATYNDGAWALFVNGQTEASGDGHRIKQSGGPVMVGRKGATQVYPDYYRGLVREVYIYDRALNAEEIAALFNRTELPSK